MLFYERCASLMFGSEMVCPHRRCRRPQIAALVRRRHPLDIFWALFAWFSSYQVFLIRADTVFFVLRVSDVLAPLPPMSRHLLIQIVAVRDSHIFYPVLQKRLHFGIVDILLVRQLLCVHLLIFEIVV